MVVAKQVADFLSASRAAIALALAWAGFTLGAAGLRTAAALLLLSWLTDALDGALARRSSRRYHTWVGDHDLQFDMAASLGVLVYLVAAGFVEALIAGLYVCGWALVFLRWPRNRSLGMLFQAPLYGYFLWTLYVEEPGLIALLAGFLLLVMIVTWPRFPKEVVPGFLGGLPSRRGGGAAATGSVEGRGPETKDNVRPK